MKLFQNFLRALIVAGSVGGFFGGWGLLAHSGKPAGSVTPPSIEVAPQQPQGRSPFTAPGQTTPRRRSSSGFQPFPSQPSPFFSNGGGFRLRSGGS